MDTGKSLKDLSLDSLMQLLLKSIEDLLASKIIEEDTATIKNNEKIVELIKREIVIRRNELPPIK